MEKKSQYPLEQIAIIKQKKLDEAEKNLRDKKKILESEEEKLKKAEKERDEVKAHRMDKLTQMREKMDEGAPASKIEQMRHYLKLVDEKLKGKELKVKEQMKQVEAAQKQVEIARGELLKKQQEVEKIATHRTEWEKEMRVIEEQKEGIESDEIGSVLHSLKKRTGQKKRREEH